MASSHHQHDPHRLECRVGHRKFGPTLGPRTASRARDNIWHASSEAGPRGSTSTNMGRAPEHTLPDLAPGSQPYHSWARPSRGKEAGHLSNFLIGQKHTCSTHEESAEGKGRRNRGRRMGQGIGRAQGGGSMGRGPRAGQGTGRREGEEWGRGRRARTDRRSWGGTVATRSSTSLARRRQTF